MRINDLPNPSTGRSRSSTVGSSGDELKDKRKKSARKRSMTKDNSENQRENTRRRRGFFGFGKSRPRRKSVGDSDYQSDKDKKLQKMKRGEEQERVEGTLKSVRPREEEKAGFVRDDSLKRRPAGSFSREQYTRRSAQDIIREMEARSKGDTAPNENVKNEKIAGKRFDSKGEELRLNGELQGGGEKARRNKNDNKEMEEKAKFEKEDEKKKHKEEEKRKKEEERKKRDEKRKHEVDKRRKEEDERKKKEDETKKREQEKNLHNKKQQTTPQNKKSMKKSLLDEIAA